MQAIVTIEEEGFFDLKLDGHWIKKGRKSLNMLGSKFREAQIVGSEFRASFPDVIVSWWSWVLGKKKESRQDLELKIPYLNILQCRYHVNDLQIRRLEEEISLWLEEEDIKWKQRAKQIWYNLGDLYTKYFHACTFQCHKRNRINHIQDHLGTKDSWPKEIDSNFQAYFQQLFATSSPTFCDIQAVTKHVQNAITPEMNEDLLATFTKEEVEIALKQTVPLKSLRPDDFNPGFYQKY